MYLIIYFDKLQDIEKKVSIFDQILFEFRKKVNGIKFQIFVVESKVREVESYVRNLLNYVEQLERYSLLICFVGIILELVRFFFFCEIV